MKKVVVLGATGMLGHMVAQELERSEFLDVIKTKRDRLTARDKKTGWARFNVEQINAPFRETVSDADYVINCIGTTKPHIYEDDHNSVRNAIVVNSYFPYRLAELSEDYGFKVINIATDCVFSGREGNYVEDSAHDAEDVYGKTKSLGEVPHENFINLRCSIIGPELERSTALLMWVLRQRENAEIGGYKNHKWNGITTLAYANICKGLIENNYPGGITQHVIPLDTVDKFHLVDMIAQQYGRHDIVVKKVRAAEKVNRTLRTDRVEINKDLWQMAGYHEIPSIYEMVHKMALLDVDNLYL